MMRSINMKKLIFGTVAIAGLCIPLAGCLGVKPEKEKNHTDENVESESLSDVFTSKESEQSLGAFSFGPLSDHDETDVYEYTGEDVRIPFQVVGMDKKGNSDFGLLVFLDGVSQPYRIEESNGTSSKEQIMHKFFLKGEESKQFEIVFTPVIGEKGETVPINFSTIFQPDYIPENEAATNYGVYHDLNATLPQEVHFKETPLNSAKLSAYSKSEIQDIPEEIKNKNDIIKTDGSSDILDEMTVFELLPENENDEIISAKNGKAKMKFRMYGGPEVTYRTTIFVNHIPVQILDSEYIETSLQKGKMNTIALELDTSAYEKINSIYAISVVSGKGYLTNAYSPLKTKSLLLLNQ